MVSSTELKNPIEYVASGNREAEAPKNGDTMIDHGRYLLWKRVGLDTAVDQVNGLGGSNRTVVDGLL